MNGILRFFGVSRAIDPPSPTYMGAFGWSVDQAYGADKIVIATHAGWDELEALTAWCDKHGCSCFWDRVVWDHWMQRWSSNGIAGYDQLFIQSDSEDTALLARMSWG